MKVIKWIVLFSLASFIAIVGSAQAKLTHADSIEGRHVLLSEKDFSEIGKAITVIPPAWVTKQQDMVPAPGLLSEWTESAAVTLLVQLGERELNNAIVNSSSYKFASAQAAQNQLEAINVSLQEAGIQELAETSVLLDAESIDLLTDQTTSWYVQAGRDDENLLAYFLWLQLDSHIMETHITVEEHNEQLGQNMLRHVIQHVLTKEASAIDIETDTEKSYPPDATRSWLTTTANSSLERSGVHFLAVWNLGSGNNQHYIGPGGDPATCGSSHGCISSWSWWMNPSSGPSKLGVPKTFLLLDQDRWNGSNYQADVWCC